MSKHFDLETFAFNGHMLRTVVIDGEPWFYAMDLLRGLGLRPDAGATQWMKPLDEGEKRRENKSTLKTSQGWAATWSQLSWLVSESGLYKIILRAQRSNPAAKAFQDWITQEVIPRIRKDGAYIKDEEKIATGEVSAEAILAKLPAIFGEKVRANEKAERPQEWGLRYLFA